MPALGEVVGSYRLDSPLGAGGMGAVYRASHVLLGREAAVKVLEPTLAGDDQYVSRFFHEAKVVNDIRHPNIIDIVDFVLKDDPRVVAYVMELLEGAPLSTVLAEHSLTMPQVLNIGLQLCEALEAVHQVHVVHRDLKPDNIFIVEPLTTDLSRVPSVKILDFGIAKFEDPSVVHKTKTGVAMGTPAYMAPEQIGGTDITPATDVYAFGEIFYELVTGDRLFKGDLMAVFKRKVTGERPRLEIPAVVGRQHIEGLVRRCTEEEPSMRPQLAEVRAMLEEIRALPSSAEIPPSLFERTRTDRPAVKDDPPISASEPTPLASAVPDEMMLQSVALRSGTFSKNQKLALGAVAGLAALAIALGGVLLSWPSSQTEPVAPAATMQKVAKEVPATPVETPKPPKAAVVDRIIWVSSKPENADVTDDATGMPLGWTPLKVELKSDQRVRKIRIAKKGFEEKLVEVGRTANELEIELTPLKKARSPKKTTRVKQKPVVEKKVEPQPQPAPRKPAPKRAAPLKKREVTSW